MTNGTFLQFEISGLASTPDSLKKKLKLEKKVDRVLIERL